MSTTWQIECTDGKKEPISLSVGKTVIGRGQLLQIRELKVSRHHAEVQITETGEFILKAMRPGLPCFYKKKDSTAQIQLQRGETATLSNGDIFSLHANPDCEFKVIEIGDEDTEGNTDDDGADGDKETAKTKESEPDDEEDEPEEANNAVSEEAEEEEEDEESDWEEKKKPKPKTGRTKKKTQPKKPPARKSPARNSRKPKRKAPSSEEEEMSASEEDSDSDYAGRRGRRQPARQQPRLPARRATKPVSYNEDLMLEGMSPSASEQESDDGMPKIGRQKKADSDSDFKVDEDSGSDWDEQKSSKKGSRRSGPPPKITPSRKRGRRRKNSESSEEEVEYTPRPSKRRSAVAASDSSQDEEEGSGKGSGSEQEEGSE